MTATRQARRLGAALAIGALALCLADPALAQLAQRPFAVGAGEGGGAAGGLAGWLLSEQAYLNHLIAAAVKALHDDPSAIWGLAGLSFAYGVFHAAGPGHGKALIASYVLANERALRRGVALAFLAALLQALVAIALVAGAAAAFHATAAQMNRAVNWLELASYGGIAAIGVWLIVNKGRLFLAALRHFRLNRAALAQGALYVGAPWSPALASGPATRFRAQSPGADPVLAEACGHVHAIDPAALGDGFSWRGAASTVLAAGMRPCSGAILVLVFSLAQGLLGAGVAATFAMALGTALTTGALAALAVFAKAAAMRLARGEASRLTLVARGIELLAAVGVLFVGVSLLLASQAGA